MDIFACSDPNANFYDGFYPCADCDLSPADEDLDETTSPTDGDDELDLAEEVDEVTEQDVPPSDGDFEEERVEDEIEEAELEEFAEELENEIEEESGEDEETEDFEGVEITEEEIETEPEIELPEPETFKVNGAEGGIFETSFGVVVSIPEDAFAGDITMGIRPNPTIDIGNARAVGAVYEFAPEGMIFDRQITVMLPYDEMAAGDDVLQYLWTTAVDDSIFANVANAELADGMGSGRVSHFSYGFIARKPPEVYFQHEQRNVTYGDDISTEAGVQVDAVVYSINLEAGTNSELTVTKPGAEETDTYYSHVDGDGMVTFEAIDILPGENHLLFTALPAEADPLTTAQAITLTGCRLRFTAPVDSATLTDIRDEQSDDCNERCGDDLDCHTPQLQYNVSAATENVADGESVRLLVDALDPIIANNDGASTLFQRVSLPPSEGLSLKLQATDPLGNPCEEEIAVNISMQCGCRISLIAPAQFPQDYNAQSLDDDEATEGFQKSFSILSDNCVNGSEVTFSLIDETDGETISETTTALFQQTASALMTLPDGALQLAIHVDEANSDREGSFGPLSFRVGRSLPSVYFLNPSESERFTKNEDMDADLTNGIQINVEGYTLGVEDVSPPGRATLQVLIGELPVGVEYETTISENTFSFENVTLPEPDGMNDPVAFTLQIDITDEVGNTASNEREVHGYFEEPNVELSHFGQAGGNQINIIPGQEIILDKTRDADDSVDLLQTTLTAWTHLIETGATVTLFVDDEVYRTTTVESFAGDIGVVTWAVSLHYGQHDIRAEAAIAQGTANQTAATSATANVWVDWMPPEPQFEVPINGAVVTTREIDIRIYADAEEGEDASLFVNDTPAGDPQTIQQLGYVAFENVSLPEETDNFTLRVDVVDKAGNMGTESIDITYMEPIEDGDIDETETEGETL